MPEEHSVGQRYQRVSVPSKSRVLRRQVLGDEQDCASHGDGADEVA